MTVRVPDVHFRACPPSVCCGGALAAVRTLGRSGDPQGRVAFLRFYGLFGGRHLGTVHQVSDH